MEVNNTRITKLREYLFNIIERLNNEYKQINVNFLSDDINNYSLDKIPTNTEVNLWILGIVKHKEVYSFRSRMDYSADVMSNIENVAFFETFEKTIKSNDDNNILPEIDGIESIKCLNCGTMNNANTNTSEWDIQIEITYREV